MRVRKLQLVTDAKAPCCGESPPRPLVRIAIATHDAKSLNAHFNNAKKFLLYEVTPRTSRVVGTIAFDDLPDAPGHPEAEGTARIRGKVAALSGCDLVFVRAIGAPAAARVIGAGMLPVKVSEAEPIGRVIGRVQRMMSANPPAWLSDAMASRATRSSTLEDRRP